MHSLPLRKYLPDGSLYNASGVLTLLRDSAAVTARRMVGRASTSSCPHKLRASVRTLSTISSACTPPLRYRTNVARAVPGLQG